MKKITIYVLMAFFASMITTDVVANPLKDMDFGDIITIMDKTAASGNMPDFIDDAGATRGAGFNGDYAFVASRQGGGDFVYYWDVNNPDAEVGTLDLTGVEGGTFVLADMTAVGDNIFVSNMVFANNEFKLYHWDGIDAEPTTLIEYDTPVRLGDAISVIGDPDEFAAIVVSAHGAAEFYIWEMVNGDLVDPEPDVLEWQVNDELTNFSRATEVTGSDMILISGPAFGPVLIDSDTFYVNHIPVDFFPGWPMYAHIFQYEGYRFLAYAHIGEDPAENVLYILDMNDGDTVDEAMDNLVASGFEDNVLHSVEIGSNPNLNASVSVDLHIDEDGNLSVMSFAAGNGFIVQKTYGDTPDTYTLHLEVQPEGSGTTTGEGEYVEGESVAVSATPAEGYQFLHWKDTDDNVVSNEPSFNYTMPAGETTLIAHFEEVSETEVSTLAELRDKPDDGTIYQYTGEAVIVAMDDHRNRKFLQD
ncbi:MAG: DUF4623 domain-containing protein, partial [Bacteroidota bacterium]